MITISYVKLVSTDSLLDSAMRSDRVTVAVELNEYQFIKHSLLLC